MGAEPDVTLIEPFIAAARELEADGVRAITTSCGFLAMFQKEMAAAVDIPVFTSSLLQAPVVYRMLKGFLGRVRRPGAGMAPPGPVATRG